ncbi:MAG: GNAT family N-acetyltransferase [Gemmatimonadetes bacterium]|nr:GNAT family N-acetyltransferase [Gemmatimonadota bacterium]
MQSQRFYEVIADTFPESTWFACGYLNGEPVSGGCGFIWDREMEITWSSSLRLASGIRPGYFLHWCFLERAAQEGCTIANFGRARRTAARTSTSSSGAAVMSRSGGTIARRTGRYRRPIRTTGRIRWGRGSGRSCRCRWRRGWGRRS